MPDIPMQPRPTGKTLGPVLPSGVERRAEWLMVSSRFVILVLDRLRTMRQRPPMGRTGLSSGRDAERSSPSGPHRRPALQRDAMRPDARGPPRGQHRPAWPLTPTLTCPLPKRRWIRVRVAHRRARCGPWFEVIRSWRLRDGTLSTHPPPSTLGLLPLVFLGGVAALCWEVLWQLEASLAMGVSAKGTALTLVATMGGMSLGAALAGRALRTRRIRRPLRLYGTLELVVGLSGVVLLLPSFRALERVSDALYASHPGLTGAVHFVGIVLLLGPPTLAMGASIPVFGLMTRGSALSVASLYAANTAGAALGVLLLSFLFLPHLGVELAAIAIACLNLSVAAVCWVSRSEAPPWAAAADPTESAGGKVGWPAGAVVFVSGFVSLGLEVAWFRALRAAFLNTTQAFAIMLVSVLLPLAGGAALASRLVRRRIPLGAPLAAGGAAILLATPVVERFDRLADLLALDFWSTIALWLGAALAVIGPPMVLLGACLPWVL